MSARTFGYASALPFAVHCSVHPFRGASGDTRLSLTGQFDSDAVENVAATLRRFADLARTGALCGADLAPWDSGARLAEPAVGTGMVSALLQDCNLDDHALTVLCDLIVGMGAASIVERLDVSSDTPAESVAVRPVDRNAYPVLYRRLPFQYVDEEPEGGGFLVRIEFFNAPKPAMESKIRDLATAWEHAVRGGAFGLPPGGSASNYLEPESMIAFANTMEWPIGKFRSDPAAVVALVNGLAAIGSNSAILRVMLTQ